MHLLGVNGVFAHEVFGKLTQRRIALLHLTVGYLLVALYFNYLSQIMIAVVGQFLFGVSDGECGREFE